MLITGLVLTGAGLLLLLVVQFRKNDASPKDARRTRGLVLAVDSSVRCIQIRYSTEKGAITSTTDTAEGEQFFPGQQVFVYYTSADSPQPVLVQSVSANLGRHFIGLSLAIALMVAGLLLIRLG